MPRAATIRVPHGTAGIFGLDVADIRWIDAARPGLRLAPVAEDRSAGRFLGLIGFDPLASTGLHQHLDVAFSYFLDGGLADYQGFARAGDMGINLKGATHDAIAYARTLAAARLEGPVLYEGPGSLSPNAPLHTGARLSPIVNSAPEVLPDLNVTVDAVAPVETCVAHVSRRTIFAYDKVERDGRSVQLRFLPGAATPPFRPSGPLSVFVIGGALSINDVRIGPAGFGIVENGTTVSLSSEFGALLLAWAEGPAPWVDRAAPDLFGF